MTDTRATVHNPRTTFDSYTMKEMRQKNCKEKVAHIKAQKHIEAQKKIFVRQISRDESEMKQLLQRLNLAKKISNAEESESFSEYSDEAFESDEDRDVEPAFVNPYPVTIIPKFQTPHAKLGDDKDNDVSAKDAKTSRQWHRRSMEYDDVDIMMSSSKNTKHRNNSIDELTHWVGSPHAISSVRRPRKSVSEQINKKCLVRASTEYFYKWDTDDIETMVSPGHRTYTALSHSPKTSTTNQCPPLKQICELKLLFSTRQKHRRAMSDSGLAGHILGLPTREKSDPRRHHCLKERSKSQSIGESGNIISSLEQNKKTRKQLLFKRHKLFLDARNFRDQDKESLLSGSEWQSRKFSLKEKPSQLVTESGHNFVDASAFRLSYCRFLDRYDSCEKTTVGRQGSGGNTHSGPGDVTASQSNEISSDVVREQNERSTGHGLQQIDDIRCSPASDENSTKPKLLLKRIKMKRSNPNSPGLSPLAKDGYFKF